MCFAEQTLKCLSKAFPEVWNVYCTILDGRAGAQNLKVTLSKSCPMFWLMSCRLQHVARQVVITGQGHPQFTNVTVALLLGQHATSGVSLRQGVNMSHTFKSKLSQLYLFGGLRAFC